MLHVQMEIKIRAFFVDIFKVKKDETLALPFSLPVPLPKAKIVQWHGRGWYLLIETV